MKQKFYSLLLAGAMLLSLAACGTNAANPSNSGSGSTPNTSQTPVTAPDTDTTQIGTATTITAGSRTIKLTLEGDEGT